MAKALKVEIVHLGSGTTGPTPRKPAAPRRAWTA
jgi:hypothetical protein